MEKGDIITQKELVNRLKQTKTITHILNYIGNKHNLQNLNVTIENPFNTLKTTTKEVKLKNVQFKILHNIYPTQKHLFKWKLSDSPYCHHCKNEVETINHAIYQCPIARKTIQNLEKIIQEELGLNINLSNTDVLFGIGKNTLYNIDYKKRSYLNTLLIIIKRKLILQRVKKEILSVSEIKNIAEYQSRLEKYITNKKGN